MRPQNASQSGRWYDTYPELARRLELLKQLKGHSRLAIIRKVKKIIHETNPGLIDHTVMNYPLTYKRRWYDADPLLWLTINGLSYCGRPVLKQAVACLKSEMDKLGIS